MVQSCIERLAQEIAVVPDDMSKLPERNFFVFFAKLLKA